MRTLMLSLSLVFAATPALAYENHPDGLMFLMKLIDQVPTKAQLLEAGSGAHGEELVAIANDTALPRYPRMRAAGALGMFEESKAALAAIVENSDDVEVRIQALNSLVLIEKSNAMPRLSALLTHAHPEIRAAANRQLARLNGAR